MTFIFVEGVTMSDPIPEDGGTEAGASEGIADEPLLDSLPPEDLPEELLLRRLGRLDTRRALAEICRNVPALEEILLPRGIQADALTRKSGGGAPLLRGLARRISHDAAAWGAFRTAIQEQIPPETFEALEGFSPENLEELKQAHTTESLLLAALSAEEVEVLTGERTDTSELVRKAEERAASALDLRGQLDERIETLERRSAQLEKALEGERSAYSRAAERVEELHEELGRVVEERDRIKNALQDARFTDRGFGELLVRALKNEVAALPASLGSTAQAAHLMEFMGRVLQAHADLRSPGEQGRRTPDEDPDDKDPSPAEIDGPAG